MPVYPPPGEAAAKAAKAVHSQVLSEEEVQSGGGMQFPGREGAVHKDLAAC